MPNLTTAEGTLAYLETTQFAATNVQLITGGHSAFTYRATLKAPLPTGDTSVILKHYEGYIAVRESVKIEAGRSVRVISTLLFQTAGLMGYGSLGIRV